MKMINYQAIKNWLSKNIEDIIDVTFDQAEPIPKRKRKVKEENWLAYVNHDYFTDRYRGNKEFEQLVDQLYLHCIHILDHHFKRENTTFMNYIRSFAWNSYEVRRFLQAVHAFARTRVIKQFGSIHETELYSEVGMLNYRLGKKERDLLKRETDAFFTFLGEPSDTLKKLFRLSPAELKPLWWDLDQSYREENNLSHSQERVLFATKTRTTKIWEGSYKNDILTLYFEMWTIIFDALSDEAGPTPNKARNLFINKIRLTAVRPYEEDKHYYFISSLIKYAENTIRKKYGLREIKVQADLENIEKRFNKAVVEKIKERVAAELALAKKMAEVEKVVEPKKIELNFEKISTSQQELTQIVDMITDFVGDENEDDVVEVVLEEKAKDEVEMPVLTETVNTDNEEIQLVFLQMIVNNNGLDLFEAEAFCEEHGLFLNAFVNQINQRLYDLVEDQVLLIEGSQIMVDDFYQEDVENWIEEQGN